LRGIPFRVVCLIGLADTSFPRQAAVTEFDLMTERPRLGDRARRHEDRAAFLDALLCAREVLYLSYPGHNVRDDSPLPPAIPVSELLDYLGRSVAGGAEAVRRRLITEHRLQPWSPHYFRAPSGAGLSGETGALFSYAADYAEVAKRARTDSGSAAQQLFIRPLPEPGPEWRQVEIDRLIDFFSHPIRFLLRERLGIHLGAGEAELPAEEPFRLGRQDGSRLAERLLPLCLAGAGDTGIAEIALAGSELPHGAPGRIELRNEWRGLV
jgi:exodeoxyribonuclease V gamma subunit